MKRVNILTAKHKPYSLIYLTPLLINRRLLKDIGITFRIFYNDSDALYSADCVLFENRIFRRWGREEQDRRAIDLLEKLRQRVDKIFWFDTTDSTGTTQFQLLPYVDKYFKAQILKDKAAYKRRYYGGRAHTDYYHSHFGVKDSDESYSPVPAKEFELNKIQLAWNASLGDFGRWSPYLKKVREYLPLPMFYSARFVDSHSRAVEVSMRFGTRYARETVAFQRQMVKQKANQLGIPTDRIPWRQYLNELRNSKVAVSPFGWGEMSFKDYEIILNGAMLVKPDMSHLLTWPDLYVAGETYLPFKWDCSDLEAVLDEALQGRKWLEIASQAQRVYRWYLFEREGREAFCNRFWDMIHD